ncbi:hypothetical protein [Pseudomonas vranovensis]|uniref:Capsule biosynthesis protein n=1 Tax=Pseudomonas vranovensis TaxID=321661 RepID=A0A423D4M7_9PSED|nr:hypothetical protein [Pseudomonas vranovensis]ROL66508.1 hypothetical protein BHU25_20145 [Pseudomonas vranovensis]
MNILMVENRYKTYFWDALAQQFIADGHTVRWVVQNPLFTPIHGQATVIAFPRGSNLTPLANDEVCTRTCKSDRLLNYFGGQPTHYNYYKSAIWQALDQAKPDLVIGEATLFHELLAVEWCKQHQVPFFHPSMPGYPGGRYSIYAGDSKEAIGVSTDCPTDEDCFALAEAIRKREKVPDYMRPSLPSDPGRVFPIHGSWPNRLTLIKSYLSGERFNTPSPLKKWRLDKAVKTRLARWAQISSGRFHLQAEQHYLLYPMQMQPESNLDLWGQAFRNQADLIGALAQAIPDNWKLLVKLNPKTKYELDDALLEQVMRRDNIVPVPYEVAMGELLEHVTMICTVTGTIAVEAVLSRKPLVQFGPGILSGEPGYVQLQNVECISQVIRDVESGAFPLADDAARTHLVKKLFTSTFTGLVSDPASLPSVLDPSNVQIIARNLLQVAERCE